jgi:hypothetical protein
MHITLKFFFIISLIILWWIAEWGAITMIIDHYSDDSKLREFSIYLGILGSILLIMHYEPRLMKHLL